MLKTKTYKFNTNGLLQAKIDYKQEKIDNVVNIGFWLFMISLGLMGVMGTDKFISLILCSLTSKTVKCIM